jgi:flagellar motor protein MotB
MEPPPEAAGTWFSRVAEDSTKPVPTSSALLEGLAPDRTGAQYTGEVLTGQSTEPPAAPPGPASAAELGGAPPQPTYQPPPPPQQAAVPSVPYGSTGDSNQRMVSEDGAVVVDFSAVDSGSYGSHLRPSGENQPYALIYFADASAAVDAQSRQVLQEVARVHQQNGGLVRVIGHASARTETQDLARQKVGNLRMSLARANAVAAALVSLGVPADRIQVAGAGDSELIYDESSPTGEAGNRRVEIYLDY